MRGTGIGKVSKSSYLTNMCVGIPDSYVRCVVVYLLVTVESNGVSHEVAGGRSIEA